MNKSRFYLTLSVAAALISLVVMAATINGQADEVPLLAASQLAGGFIKFDGIDGEAQDKDHAGWSDLSSFSQSIHKPGAGTGATRRRGDVVMEDILVTKELDKASPKIAEAVLKGNVFPKVEIHLTASYTEAGRVTYYAYELKNVQVSSYQTSSSDTNEQVPVDSFSLNFEEIKVTYTEFDNAGAPKGETGYLWKVERGAR